MGCSSSVPKNDDAPDGVPKGDGDVPHVLKVVYKLGDVLGEGAFSVVKLAVNRKTGQKVAVKCIDRQGLPEEDENSLRQEVAIMKALKHKNIVEFIDFFEEEKFFYVVLEILEGGELFDRIVEKNFYNEKEARDVVKVILDGMKYCHDKGIAHRDMKPENLLLTSKEDDSNVKIADFGFAIRGAQKSALTTQCGTPGYVAPEILQNQPYDKSCDMWSIGVITYILLGGYPPFHDDNQKALFKKIKSGEFEFHDEYWECVSAEAKDFISKLIIVDPKSRMSCDDAHAHPWLQATDKDLASHDLNHNLQSLKNYQKNKKFRAAANAIRAGIRLSNMLGVGSANKSASTTSAPEPTTSDN